MIHQENTVSKHPMQQTEPEGNLKKCIVIVQMSVVRRRIVVGSGD